MFGIPGISLGAILKATGKNYKDLAIIAVFYAIIVIVGSIVSLAFFGTEIAELIPVLPETITPILTGGFLVVIGGLIAGIYAFLSLLWGAALIDIIDWFLRAAR